MQDHGGKSGANMKWLLRLFLKGAKKNLQEQILIMKRANNALKRITDKSLFPTAPFKNSFTLRLVQSEQNANISTAVS